jgi:hypothetical protein
MSKLKVDELEESTSGQNITVASGTNLVVTDSLTVGGAAPYTAGGTDVAVADGGTGAGTATAGFDALSPMTTAGDIMYGGSSGTVTRLAASTDGHVLTSTGAGSAPAWEAAGGGTQTGWDLLDSDTSGDPRTLDQNFDGGHHSYMVLGKRIRLGTNNAHLEMTIKLASPGGWRSSNYGWGLESIGDDYNGASFYSASDSSFRLAYGVGNGSAHASVYLDFQMYFHSAGDNYSVNRFNWVTSFENDGRDYRCNLGGGSYTGSYDDYALEGIRIQSSSGGVTAGAVYVYGMVD